MYPVTPPSLPPATTVYAGWYTFFVPLVTSVEFGRLYLQIQNFSKIADGIVGKLQQKEILMEHSEFQF